MINTKTKKGFTLIELLVVIAIIALLASIVLVSVASVRKNYRDAQRASDIRNIIKALDFYYDANSSYPITSVSDCAGATGFQTGLQTLVSNGYLNVIPHDPFWPNNGPGPQPINANSYCYQYFNPVFAVDTCGGIAPTSSGGGYEIRFRPEKTMQGFAADNSSTNSQCGPGIGTGACCFIGPKK